MCEVDDLYGMLGVEPMPPKGRRQRVARIRATGTVEQFSEAMDVTREQVSNAAYHDGTCKGLEFHAVRVRERVPRDLRLAEEAVAALSNEQRALLRCMLEDV